MLNVDSEKINMGYNCQVIEYFYCTSSDGEGGGFSHLAQ